MKPIVIPLIILMASFAEAQVPLSNFEKATYQEGDFREVLYQNIRYPREALKAGTEGHAVISIFINNEGEMGDIKVLSSNRNMFIPSATNAMQLVTGDWEPTKINGEVVGKEYFVIFRFSMQPGPHLEDHRKKVEKYLRKRKPEKALEVTNKAINENPYDRDLLLLRQGLFKILGDSKSAEKDKLRATQLEHDILGVIELKAMWTKRVRKVRTIGPVIRL